MMWTTDPTSSAVPGIGGFVAMTDPGSTVLLELRDVDFFTWKLLRGGEPLRGVDGRGARDVGDRPSCRRRR